MPHPSSCFLDMEKRVAILYGCGWHEYEHRRQWRNFVVVQDEGMREEDDAVGASRSIRLINVSASVEETCSP